MICGEYEGYNVVQKGNVFPCIILLLDCIYVFMVFKMPSECNSTSVVIVKVFWHWKSPYMDTCMSHICVIYAGDWKVRSFFHFSATVVIVHESIWNQALNLLAAKVVSLVWGIRASICHSSLSPLFVFFLLLVGFFLPVFLCNTMCFCCIAFEALLIMCTDATVIIGTCLCFDKM